MDRSPIRTIYSAVTDFLMSDPTPQEIIDYHVPDDLQARATVLLDKNNKGILTDQEHDELMDFLRMEHMMSLLKAKSKVRKTL